MTSEQVQKRKTEAELLKASRKLSMESLDRKAHWGTGVKIDEYEEAVKNAVDTEPLEQALDQFGQETLVTENLFDRLASQIDFTDLFAASMVENLQGIVAETFQRGSSRVVTTEGETLDVGFDAEPRRLVEQLQQQEIYLKNLAEDSQEKVRDVIVKGSEEGKSIGEMKDEIVNEVEDLTSHRAETIARSEVVEASNEGSKAAMEEAGIEKVMIHAEIDRQTCEEGSFSWTGPDGTEYTTCRDWHQEVFNREDVPSIPSESHPNDRCALIAHVE